MLCSVRQLRLLFFLHYLLFVYYSLVVVLLRMYMPFSTRLRVPLRRTSAENKQVVEHLVVVADVVVLVLYPSSFLAASTRKLASRHEIRSVRTRIFSNGSCCCCVLLAFMIIEYMGNSHNLTVRRTTLLPPHATRRIYVSILVFTKQNTTPRSKGRDSTRRLSRDASSNTQSFLRGTGKGKGNGGAEATG